MNHLVVLLTSFNESHCFKITFHGIENKIKHGNRNILK